MKTLGFLEALFGVVTFFWITEQALSNPVVFAEGDASFVGLVHEKSTSWKNTTDDKVVQAATLFCCGQELDYSLGIELDVSIIPTAQFETLKTVVNGLISDSELPGRYVLLCVTAEDFDFESNWLGIPYNRNPFRLKYTDTPTNCFGPTGSSSLSVRDAEHIEPLPVDVVNEERFRLTGKCCFCILTPDNVILQKVRHVIRPDGSKRVIDFKYQPNERVCFEEGDAFFVARADKLLQSKDNSVELEYVVSGRRNYAFYSRIESDNLLLSKEELASASLELPVKPRGRRLLLKNAPLLDQVDGLDRVEDRPWFAFVVPSDYDPKKHGLGIRYNKRRIEWLARPLPFEFIDCNFCTETFPVPIKEGNWPPSLNVSWDGDDAVADMVHCQLILFQYWQDVPFYRSELRRKQIRIWGDRIEYWSDGNLVRKLQID